jgi:hypothetical protein
MRRISSSLPAPTNRSCVGWTNSIGTVTWLSSERASQVRTLRRRVESTFGLTDEITPLTRATKEYGASRPTSNSLTAIAGGATRKQIGDNHAHINRRHPRTGLVANPAQITNPLRFCGLVAAHSIARGEEKDSAISRNGAETQVADRSSSVKFVEEGQQSFGYRTTSVSNPLGSASRKAANSSPVPSIPGKSTSLGAGEDIEPDVSRMTRGSLNEKSTGRNCFGKSPLCQAKRNTPENHPPGCFVLMNQPTNYRKEKTPAQAASSSTALPRPSHTAPSGCRDTRGRPPRAARPTTAHASG